MTMAVLMMVTIAIVVGYIFARYGKGILTPERAD